MFANIFKSAKSQVVEEANAIYYEMWRTNKAVTVVKESYYNDTFRVSCGCLQVHIYSHMFGRLVPMSTYETRITTNNNEILKYFAVALAASNQGRNIEKFLDCVKLVDLSRN